VCCPIGDLLQTQVSESAHAYAKAMLDMLQVPDVRSEEYSEASTRSLRAQAKLSDLKDKIDAHCKEHERNGQAAGRRWKRLSFADVPLQPIKTQETA
jgi:hypothetical protein